jgi:hypothetical protein
MLAKSTNFRATTSLDEGIAHSDQLWILVDTPSTGGDRCSERLGEEKKKKKNKNPSPEKKKKKKKKKTCCPHSRLKGIFASTDSSCFPFFRIVYSLTID